MVAGSVGTSLLIPSNYLCKVDERIFPNYYEVNSNYPEESPARPRGGKTTNLLRKRAGVGLSLGTNRQSWAFILEAIASFGTAPTI